MKTLRVVGLLFALGLPSSQSVAAVHHTVPSTVKMYVIGWHYPDLLVQLSSQTVNPDNCSNGDMYIVPSNSPLIQSITATVISAEATGKQIKLVIDGCYGNRPQIIGIYVGQV